MPEEYSPLAVRIANAATDQEKVLLIGWLESLLEIKKSDLGRMEKGKQALAVTARSKVILPTLKLIASETGLARFNAEDLKFSSVDDALRYMRKLWSDRSLPAKMGLGFAAVSSILFGSQGAGIAALGSAVGVPLWIVFGAGATFATVLYEEIKGR